MIDEERLNLFVEIAASILYGEARSQDTKELLDDFAENGILVKEDDEKSDV